MFDVRCGGCNRLLARASGFQHLQIKCPRCRTLNALTAASCIEPERHGAPVSEVAHGSEAFSPSQSSGCVPCA
ncbi:Com family DNA-binding transcriptional regulator [Pseudomonas aeruginosa]|nr:Com family DNA-binding transcriptional regulator [Pseudomonas aeruginosa]ASC96507.1 Com family DNA-binding transcriptional regulator [Pseudomonas aeruginosa]ASC96513.1 Com family DNA-binding transcriptional regulator [Pseudomonas aeruginosa]EIU3604559.1 Com family DNA-binding transcriptional regulator [Pseudomonas aeruginosa]EIU3804373.1 Com family DNA-binding transcriptional regulator [Pseudomonas aeruginosa]EKU1962853.1 Com family DNA-binding transcriptional regulator [Pseudomonas aerugin